CFCGSCPHSRSPALSSCASRSSPSRATTPLGRTIRSTSTSPVRTGTRDSILCSTSGSLPEASGSSGLLGPCVESLKNFTVFSRRKWSIMSQLRDDHLKNNPSPGEDHELQKRGGGSIESSTRSHHQTDALPSQRLAAHDPAQSHRLGPV